MCAAQRSCGLLLAVAFLLLGASSARAGARSVVTGPVYVKSNDLDTCAATNGSRGTVTNVTFSIRTRSGAPVQQGACPSTEPGNACPLGPFSTSAQLGWIVCEVSSDQGAKALRVTLQNIDGGSTVSAP
jgi:hypothetical protein